ncbi:pickpocket protein 28-like isoform X2 [Lycorma delicatula]|uniref:pickpocket protein 28-like isoform X2 n=1 Tax=Lycorma delicatula TaxID=130591 RepID=UPI003F517FE9
MIGLYLDRSRNLTCYQKQHVNFKFELSLFVICIIDVKMHGSGEINDSLPKPRRRFLKNTFEDYCEDSSLHGVKYLVAKDRPRMERCFWIFATALSFAVSLYFIVCFWNKWGNSPVIVSLDESTAIWKIPFPSVTICSETKSRQSVFNFTMYHHTNDSDLSDEEIKKREAVTMTCEPHILNKGNDYLDQFSIDFMEHVAPPFEELAWICRFGQKLVPCENIFTPIMTDDGLCITSNTLNHDDFYVGYGLNSKYLKTLPKSLNWDLENGYLDNSKLETYPRRILYGGNKLPLNVVMIALNKDLDRFCRWHQGFTVLLHNPTETPILRERYIRVQLNQEVTVAVKPAVITTSKTLLGYSPYERKCFFQHERSLTYFKVYNQNNCELECLTKFTLKECGCVAYYMPLKMVENEIFLSNKNGEIKSNCDCFISCSSIQYEAETSQTDFRWEKILSAYKSIDFESLHLSRINIYYKESQFLAKHRSELYGYGDFLGTCGGLMGLYCGFSILSLIEIIYYATIRLYNNMKENKIDRTPTKIKVKDAV